MVKAKCTNCEYEWESTSKMFKVSCPSCGNKVKIRELKASQNHSPLSREVAPTPALRHATSRGDDLNDANCEGDVQ